MIGRMMSTSKNDGDGEIEAIEAAWVRTGKRAMLGAGLEKKQAIAVLGDSADAWYIEHALPRDA